MNKLFYWIWGVLIALFGFLFGFLIRQPKINKLKKQIERLHDDIGRLQKLCQNQQDNFKNLLIQHKALKALSFRKKAASKEKLKENLILQYAIRDYLELLLKRVKCNQELSKVEIAFLKASEKIIDGKTLSTSDKVKIKDFTLNRHSTEINNLQECDYTMVFQELSNS